MGVPFNTVVVVVVDVSSPFNTVVVVVVGVSSPFNTVVVVVVVGVSSPICFDNYYYCCPCNKTPISINKYMTQCTPYL